MDSDNQSGSNSSGNEFTGDNSYQSNLIPPNNNQNQNPPPQQYYNQYPPQPIYPPQPQTQGQPQPQPYPPYAQTQAPYPYPYPNGNMGYQSNDFTNTPPQPQGNVSYNQPNNGEAYQVTNKNEINVVKTKLSINRLIGQIVMIAILYIYSLVDIIFQIACNLFNLAMVDDILMLLLGTLILYFTIRRQTSKRPLVACPGILMFFIGLVCRIIGYYAVLYNSGSFPIAMNIIKFMTFVVVAGNTNYENTRMNRGKRRRKK